MGVEKFLDVSTGHITHEDSQYLSIGYDNFPARVIPHEYGWWINVPEKKLWEEESKADCMRKQGYSEGLISVLMFARNNDCWWVNLDCDGEYVDGLKIFEW